MFCRRPLNLSIYNGLHPTGGFSGGLRDLKGPEVGWVGLYGRYGDVGVFVNMCVYVCFVRMCGAGVCVCISYHCDPI